MSDGRPKPAIPAWQRTAQTKPPPTEDPVSSQPESAQSEHVHEPKEVPEATTGSEEPESVPSGDTSPTTAPAAEVIESQAKTITSTFDTSDFDGFMQQQAAENTPTPQPQQQRPAAPPIITYPEFLVEAHKPPPFITPTRVINAVYAAGGVAALLYGASKWIISPMVENLSEARHDFLSHSQNKVDDFNERLAKIVSKIPDTKKSGAAEEDEDAESETSDPTELYHRDMGTQTSPPVTPGPSTTEPKKDAVTYQTGSLEIMKSHIEEMAEGAERSGDANKDRQDQMNKLRHYLDGLIYGGPTISAWQSSEDAISMKNGAEPKSDAIEELKKEIRGVKGVLLSAKRFPAVSRPISGAA